MPNLTRSLLPSGTCVLTFDRPDSSANIFDADTFAELNAHLDWLESTEGAVAKGLILASAKPKIFLAGADLHGFTKDPSPEKISDLIRLGHRTFARITKLRIPSCAAIHGLALGGGCEVSLACDWRVASTDKETKIGLPETMIGILPGWGGSTLLPRLVGLPAALPMILGGKQMAAVPALKIGLVDAVGPRESLLPQAEKLLAKGKRPPGKRQWANLAPAAALIARKAKGDVLAKTGGHYPAPLRALEVAVQNLRGTVEEGFENERKAFVELATGPEARQLLGIFMLQERAKKLPLPADMAAPAKPAPEIKRAAVIGAGVMGAGIAQWLAARGTNVLLKDVAAEPLAKGMQGIGKLFGDAVKRRRFTPAEAQAARDRIIPAATDVPMRDRELVIEAALEKLEVKQELFRALEKAVGPDAVLATNTSALSVDAIASALERPERLVGIHFFNPVHKMQLVEVVRGPRTSPEALDAALRFVKAIGKLPVIARDRPGFIVNRILTPYIAQAGLLLIEGYRTRDIDRAMERFGMPMGPLRLMDEVGLDIGRHVAADLAARLDQPVPQLGAMGDEMIGRKWLGRKTGRGFYVHAPGSKKAEVNVDVERLPGMPTEMKPANAALFHDRLLLPMINEAARVLEEGVADAPEDVDFAMIFGTGFAPFRGGPLRYADTLGAQKIVAGLEALAAKHGGTFAPCARLKEMARDGKKFYPDAPAAAA